MTMKYHEFNIPSNTCYEVIQWKVSKINKQKNFQESLILKNSKYLLNNKYPLAVAVNRSYVVTRPDECMINILKRNKSYQIWWDFPMPGDDTMIFSSLLFS